MSLILSPMWSGMNKEKVLGKAVWVNEIVLFLQPFCFAIKLPGFQTENLKLCCSYWCYSCVTHFGSIFLFVPSEKIKNLCFSDVFIGYKKLTLTSTGLILVMYRN